MTETNYKGGAGRPYLAGLYAHASVSEAVDGRRLVHTIAGESPIGAHLPLGYLPDSAPGTS